MAGGVDRCCKETEEQVKHLDDHLIPVLREYVLCYDTLKAVLKRRDNIQADFKAKTEVLAIKKTDRDTMRYDLDKAEDWLDWENNALKSDWTRWQKVMRTDL